MIKLVDGHRLRKHLRSSCCGNIRIRQVHLRHDGIGVVFLLLRIHYYELLVQADTDRLCKLLRHLATPWLGILLGTTITSQIRIPGK